MPRRFDHAATRSNNTAVINSAIGKWINTTCCACLANSAALKSKGFTITLPLPKIRGGCGGHDAPPAACRAAAYRCRSKSFAVFQSAYGSDVTGYNGLSDLLFRVSTFRTWRRSSQSLTSTLWLFTLGLGLRGLRLRGARTT